MSINCKGKIYMALGQKAWARAQRYISPVWLGGVFTLNIKREIKQVFTPMNLRFAVFLEALFFLFEVGLDDDFIHVGGLGMPNLTESPKTFAFSSLLPILPLKIRNLRVSSGGGRRRENAFPHF